VNSIDFPIGYFLAVVAVAVPVLLALRPARLPAPFTFVGTAMTLLGNELPFIALYVLVVATILALSRGSIVSPASWAIVALAVIVAAGLGRIVKRALPTQDLAWSALGATVGDATKRRRIPWRRVLLAPNWFARRDVEHIANLPYGPHETAHLLDIYRPLVASKCCPVFIHFHGGSFRSGSKNREARPLLYDLAGRGWLCVSANYRLGAQERFPNNLIDVKSVLAWVHQHGSHYGADPDRIVIAGSSVGAYLATMAALTANDPRFQPGFETVYTAVSGIVGLYGYYDRVGTDSDIPTDPVAHVHADAPPFFMIHGDRDIVVSVDNVLRFVAALHSASTQPVNYVELPGAPHGFDYFHSIRFDGLIEPIAAFVQHCVAVDRIRNSRPTSIRSEA
jgi:acetyl esterase/lipase